MFNLSVELTSGDSQILRAVNPALRELEIVVLNYGFEAVSGDPVLKLHGQGPGSLLTGDGEEFLTGDGEVLVFPVGGDVFPVIAHGVAAGDNFDTGQDPLPNDAFMGGMRLGPGRDLVASVTGAGKSRITLWGYIIYGGGRQKWNDKGGEPQPV